MTAADILATYGDTITKYAGQYGVDPNEIASVIQTESSGNPNAFRAEPKYPPGSYGLMQILYTTAQGLGYAGTPDGLFDVDTNINLGTQLWAQLKGQYGDDPAALYSAYNSGSATAYQSNSQVSSNVQRFLDSLSSLATEAGQAISENPETSTGLLIGGALLLFLMSRRKA